MKHALHHQWNLHWTSRQLHIFVLIFVFTSQITTIQWKNFLPLPTSPSWNLHLGGVSHLFLFFDTNRPTRNPLTSSINCQWLHSSWPVASPDVFFLQSIVHHLPYRKYSTQHFPPNDNLPCSPTYHNPTYSNQSHPINHHLPFSYRTSTDHIVRMTRRRAWGSGRGRDLSARPRLPTWSEERRVMALSYSPPPPGRWREVFITGTTSDSEEAHCLTLSISHALSRCLTGERLTQNQIEIKKYFNPTQMCFSITTREHETELERISKRFEHVYDQISINLALNWILVISHRNRGWVVQTVSRVPL